jgi:hypothetical protein
MKRKFNFFEKEFKFNHLVLLMLLIGLGACGAGGPETTSSSSSSSLSSASVSSEPVSSMPNKSSLSSLTESSVLPRSSASSVTVNPPIDQCDSTAQCRITFPSATDCKNSASDRSVCMCGSLPCMGSGNTSSITSSNIPSSKATSAISNKSSSSIKSSSSSSAGVDSDGDGVVDTLDECPDDVAIGSVNGCPDYDVANGERLYLGSEQNCKGCHDKAGTSQHGTSTTFGATSDIVGLDGKFKCEKTSCTDVKILADYIQKNMPLGKVGQCKGVCARDIGYFINTTFAKLDNPKDTDKDGVIENDLCPNTPSSQIASVAKTGKFLGCSTEEQKVDADKDGVPDVIDQCKLSAPGEVVNESGCSGLAELETGAVVSPQVRLMSIEYRNTLKTAFKLSELPGVVMPNDVSDGIFFNNVKDNIGNYEQFLETAEAYAKSFAPAIARACNWKSTVGTCVAQEFTGPLKILYREPTVASADTQAITMIISALITKGATVETAVAAGITRALVDERFLFKMENGDAGQALTKRKLSNKELANRLSFLLTDAPPDAALTNAIGSLSTPATLQTQVTRLLGLNEYKESMWLFVSGWLGLEQTMPESSASALERSMYEETRRFVDYIATGKAPFNDLFIANYSFINATLAKHYGVPAPATDWAMYVFPENAKRKGILTQASFLSAFGKDHRDVSWIFRGKAIYERLFCETLPPPPPDAATTVVASRESTAPCSSCHKIVDPIGRLFDNYDEHGALRTVDISNTLSSVRIGVDIDGDYSDPVAFANVLPNSKALTHCVTKMWYRYALGRKPNVIESTNFATTKMALEKNGSLNDMVKAFMGTDSFSSVHVVTPTQSCPR